MKLPQSILCSTGLHKLRRKLLARDTVEDDLRIYAMTMQKHYIRKTEIVFGADIDKGQV
jgi:hypothetical protein